MGALETPIQRTILAALAAKRVFCWRNNAGAVMVGTGKSKRPVQMAPPGSPDIIGILPGGVMFGLEVKSATGRQSATQKTWQTMMESVGARYAVVRSAREAIAAIRGWSGTP